MTRYFRCTATTQIAFDVMYGKMAQEVLDSSLTNVGEWQAQKGVNGETLEVTHVRVDIPIPRDVEQWGWQVGANFPWAEDHFKERVGGEPLNPPPSEQWWPFAVQGNAGHKAGKIFSHTYPERFWPRFANEGNKTSSGRQVFVPHQGIRYPVGDYNNLIEVLRENIHTRQAYLPIWFPEDLAAADSGERVPCSLGYHFLVRRGKLDVEYHIRSCDMVRHFRDDVYMAGRLVYDLIWKLQEYDLQPGELVMNIGSLHAFPPDRFGLEKFLSGSAARFSKHLMEQL